MTISSHKEERMAITRCGNLVKMEVDENMNAPSKTMSARCMDCLEEGQQK